MSTEDVVESAKLVTPCNVAIQDGLRREGRFECDEEKSHTTSLFSRKAVGILSFFCSSLEADDPGHVRSMICRLNNNVKFLVLKR